MSKKSKSKIITKEEDIDEHLNIDDFISKIVDIINNEIEEGDKEFFITELRDWCEGIICQLEDPEHYMYCNCLEEN